jgi:hypothetical protein
LALGFGVLNHWPSDQSGSVEVISLSSSFFAGAMVWKWVATTAEIAISAWASLS